METKKRGPRGAYKVAHYQSKRVTMDKKTVETLTAFGDGNLSQGVRMAAAFIDDWQTYNGLPPPPPHKCFVL